MAHTTYLVLLCILYMVFAFNIYIHHVPGRYCMYSAQDVHIHYTLHGTRYTLIVRRKLHAGDAIVVVAV